MKLSLVICISQALSNRLVPIFFPSGTVRDNTMKSGRDAADTRGPQATYQGGTHPGRGLHHPFTFTPCLPKTIGGRRPRVCRGIR